MDDLTELTGIGKSSAAALAKAGFTTFAAIAAADPESRPDGLSPSLDWADVIAQAKTKASSAQGPAGETQPAVPDATPPVVGTQSAAPNTSEASPVPDEEEPLSGEFMLVTGPKKGRWRGGLHFTPTPVRLQLDKLSEGQEDLIRGDKTLTCVMLTADQVNDMQREAEDA